MDGWIDLGCFCLLQWFPHFLACKLLLKWPSQNGRMGGGGHWKKWDLRLALMYVNKEQNATVGLDDIFVSECVRGDWSNSIKENIQRRWTDIQSFCHPTHPYNRNTAQKVSAESNTSLCVCTGRTGRACAAVASGQLCFRWVCCG